MVGRLLVRLGGMVSALLVVPAEGIAAIPEQHGGFPGRQSPDAQLAYGEPAQEMKWPDGNSRALYPF